MLDAIIVGAVVVSMAAGFWWTRGSGGIPGGLDDPARTELQKYTPLGDRLPDLGEETMGHEHEIE
jgi:hypothetical protein